MDEFASTRDEPKDDGPSVIQQRCWRCRNLFGMQDAVCPVCDAPNRAMPVARYRAKPGSVAERALTTVCIWYGIILAADVLFGWTLSQIQDQTPYFRAVSLMILDLVFVIAIVITVLKTRSVPDTREPQYFPVMAWSLALPLLALALFTNITFHQVIIQAFGLPFVDYQSNLDSLMASIWLICITPALTEEFFFRGIVWKTFRPHMGPHATILVTSAMFGMAHIGVPLSVPVLFGIGVVLGYQRLWSGGLLLPMIMHFLHNLVVILW